MGSEPFGVIGWLLVKTPKAATSCTQLPYKNPDLKSNCNKRDHSHYERGLWLQLGITAQVIEEREVFKLETALAIA